jgi:citrate synthase
MSTAPSSNKYFIKSLEEEIGLFDRKLAHLLKFETFPSDAERQVAAGKLSAKRERLIRTVRDLIEGVPAPDAPPAKKAKAAAKPKTSTRSKAAAKSAAPTPVQPASETVIPVAEVPEQPVHIDSETPTLPRLASPYAGTSMDSEQELKNYLQNRAKN